jgi:hypothetical protein
MRPRGHTNMDWGRWELQVYPSKRLMTGGGMIASRATLNGLAKSEEPPPALMVSTCLSDLLPQHPTRSGPNERLND